MLVEVEFSPTLRLYAFDELILLPEWSSIVNNPLTNFFVLTHSKSMANPFLLSCNCALTSCNTELEFACLKATWTDVVSSSGGVI
jgi:hypothetical protein